MAGRDEFTQHADATPLDNSTIDCLDTAETVQEGFEEICGKIQDVQQQATPGFTWGDSGAIKNSYLLNDTVPSNLSGRICTVTGNLTTIFVTTQTSGDEYTLEIRRRDNGSFTTIATLVTYSNDNKRSYIISGLMIPVTIGDELAAYVLKSGNKGATNPTCGIILEGVSV
jgi:hypothetical protein